MSKAEKTLKTRAEIKELCDAMQTGIGICCLGTEKKLRIKINGSIEFTRPAEPGLLVFFPDSKGVWQKWLGEFWKSLQERT
jgi:hypothetical protein